MSKWFLITVPVKMPAADKNGSVYACKCDNYDWKGTWADGLDHVARTYLDEVPYHCLPCGYNSATERDIDNHMAKLSTLVKRVVALTGLVVSYQSGFDVGSHLVKLSTAESQELWNKTSHARASSAVAKRKRSSSHKARRSSSSSSTSSSPSSSSSSSSPNSSDSTIIFPVKRLNHSPQPNQMTAPQSRSGQRQKYLDHQKLQGEYG